MVIFFCYKTEMIVLKGAIKEPTKVIHLIIKNRPTIYQNCRTK